MKEVYNALSHSHSISPSNNLITSGIFLYPIPLLSIITRGASTAHALTDFLLSFRSIITLCPQNPSSSSSFLALTRFTVDFSQRNIFSATFSLQPSLEELAVNGLESDHALSEKVYKHEGQVQHHLANK